MSSWGPTVFAVLSDAEKADELARAFARRLPYLLESSGSLSHESRHALLSVEE